MTKIGGKSSAQQRDCALLDKSRAGQHRQRTGRLDLIQPSEPGPHQLGPPGQLTSNQMLSEPVRLQRPKPLPLRRTPFMRRGWVQVMQPPSDPPPTLRRI